MSKVFTIPTKFTAVDGISPVLGRMSASLEKFVRRANIQVASGERHLRRYTDRLNAMAAPLTKIKNALGNVGLYLGGFVVYSVFKDVLKTISDFQQAQVEIRAVTNNNISGTKALADNARELALRYGQTASNILATSLALVKMGYSAKDAVLATEAVTKGSIAMKADPESLAKQVGASMLAFKLPKGSEGLVVDLFAKAIDLSALDWSDLETMLPIAQNAAKISGKSLPELLSLFSVIRNAQVQIASGSTAVKNMFIKNAINDRDFAAALTQVSGSKNQLNAAFKLFGPKTLVTTLPLAEAVKVGDYERLFNKLISGAEGYSDSVAKMKLESINGQFSKMSTAYDEMILAFDDGNGSFSKLIENTLRASQGLFLLNSNTDAAKKAFSELSPEIKIASKFMNGLLQALIDLAIAFTIIGTLLLLSKLRLMWLAFAANYAAISMDLLAISVGLVKASLMALWNSPVIAGMLAAFSAVMGLYIVFQMLDGIIQNVQHTWEEFTQHGFGAGMKALGATILDVLFYPLQKVQELVNQIVPSWLQGDGFARIRKFYGATYDVPVMGSEYGDSITGVKEAINPKVSMQEVYTLQKEIMQKQQIELLIKGQNGLSAETLRNDTGVPVIIGSTMQDWSN